MESSPATAAECPSCHATVSLEALECPKCGEPFEPMDGVAEPERSRSGLREKLLFYVGIVLILLGGPGIALGSWLHDVLRVSILNYDAFDVFGPMNRLVLAVGLITMIVGVVFLILSLRFSRAPGGDLDRTRVRDA